MYICPHLMFHISLVTQGLDTASVVLIYRAAYSAWPSLLDLRRPTGYILGTVIMK